jgi:hypothetical protein
MLGNKELKRFIYLCISIIKPFRIFILGNKKTLKLFGFIVSHKLFHLSNQVEILF